MAPSACDGGAQGEPSPAQPEAVERCANRLRRYTAAVTIGMILACNAVVLLGLWISGVNLETIYRAPDVFNPNLDICLRQSWHKVQGVERPIQLCYEWINTSDPSGRTHTFQPDTVVVKGADGRLYFEYGPRVDHRLLLLVLFIVGVLAVSIKIQRAMIERFRKRLEAGMSA